MIDKQQILIRVREIFCERFKLTPERVHEEAKLDEDLGLDSIDMFDLLTVFEKESGKMLGLHEFRTVKTVKDLVDSLYSDLTSPSTPSLESEHAHKQGQ